jgi:hypothetical protein
VVATIAQRAAPDPTPDRGAGTGGIRRRAAILAVVGLIVVGSAGAFVAGRHRHARPPVFPAVDAQPNVVGPAKVNEQYNVGLSLSRHDLEIENITPIVSRDSAPAATAVTVCRDAHGPVLGAAPGNLAAACNALDVPRGVRLGPNDFVIVTIVPLRRGVIELRGIRVSARDHSHRWQEATGLSVRLSVR